MKNKGYGRCARTNNTECNIERKEIQWPMRSGNMMVNMLNKFAVLAHQGLMINNFAIRVYLF